MDVCAPDKHTVMHRLLTYKCTVPLSILTVSFMCDSLTLSALLVCPPCVTACLQTRISPLAFYLPPGQILAIKSLEDASDLFSICCPSNSISTFDSQ